MPQYICEFCRHEFTAKSSLNRHQKRAKYCLELQGEKQEQQLVCECGKEFTRRDNLRRHKDRSCTKEQVALQQPPDQQLEMMKIMADLVKSTGNNNNNNNTTVNTINLQPITYNYMQTEGNKLLTEQVVMEGRQPEIAGKILGSRVRVADKARKKIEYQDEEGNLSNDGKKLTQGFFKAIQGKNKELADEAYREIHRMVDEFIAADNAGAQEFTKLLMAGTDLQNMLMAINNVVDGVENEESEKLINTTIKKIIN